MALFGSSGIRRVVDKAFLELVFQIGLAVGAERAPVVVGCDTRSTSEAVKCALVSGLLASGSKVWEAGITPTPTLAYVSRRFHAGAEITASHNPPEYNGVKLVNSDGSAFDSQQRETLEQTISAGAFRLASWDDVGSCLRHEGAVDEHVERIMADVPDGLGVRVAVDCGGGAASEVTPDLLERLGCHVTRLNCEPSSRFPRGAEPVPENLKDLVDAVRAERADLGIAHDGDADRIVVVDDRGRFVSGDKLMILFARQLGAAKLVTTVDASMIVDELGVETVRTRVGDAYVSDVLRCSSRENQKLEFGGEPSGCFIFPTVSLCPDGIYAAAKVVQLASERRLSGLVDEIPSYPILRGTTPGDRSAMARIQSRLSQRAGGKLDTVDGLRLALDDGWLLVRPSGTEPRIRITAEASSEKRSRELYELAVMTVEQCVKEQEGAPR
jgi:phosphoglucosamine mutase